MKGQASMCVVDVANGRQWYTFVWRFLRLDLKMTGQWDRMFCCMLHGMQKPYVLFQRLLSSAECEVEFIEGSLEGLQGHTKLSSGRSRYKTS